MNYWDKLGLSCSGTYSLSADLINALENAWNASFDKDGDYVHEEGGSMIETQGGSTVRPGRPDWVSPGNFNNYPQPGTGEHLTGTYHTHPYTISEGGHKNVSFSCQDIGNFFQGNQGKTKVVMAGDSIFILTVGDAAKLKNCIDCCGTYTSAQNAAHGAGAGLPAQSEAGVQAAIKKCGICYYKVTRGPNGKFSQAATLQN